MVAKVINHKMTQEKVIDNNITVKIAVKDNPANSKRMKKVVSSNTADLSLKDHLQLSLI